MGGPFPTDIAINGNCYKKSRNIFLQPSAAPALRFQAPRSLLWSYMEPRAAFRVTCAMVEVCGRAERRELRQTAATSRHDGASPCFAGVEPRLFQADVHRQTCAGGALDGAPRDGRRFSHCAPHTLQSNAAECRPTPSTYPLVVPRCPLRTVRIKVRSCPLPLQPSNEVYARPHNTLERDGTVSALSSSSVSAC